jgi:hypothetical protein
MGVLTFLVSDSTKEFCSLGKVFLDETIVNWMKINKDEKALCEWLRASDGDFNRIDPGEADWVSGIAFTWMQAHPDWRFVTEVSPEYDEAYLAENDEDAREYREEFGSDEDEVPIYKKTGSI